MRQVKTWVKVMTKREEGETKINIGTGEHEDTWRTREGKVTQIYEEHYLKTRKMKEISGER